MYDSPIWVCTFILSLHFALVSCGKAHMRDTMDSTRSTFSRALLLGKTGGVRGVSEWRSPRWAEPRLSDAGQYRPTVDDVTVRWSGLLSGRDERQAYMRVLDTPRPLIFQSASGHVDHSKPSADALLFRFCRDLSCEE
jgi:hypothetical protein